jgi:ubiquitin-protein ligase
MALQVKFLTRIYHPNVKTDSGEICNEVLTEVNRTGEYECAGLAQRYVQAWAPTLTLLDVLGIIRQVRP